MRCTLHTYARGLRSTSSRPTRAPRLVGTTDDILEGRAREVEVPAELAEVHAQTQRILGARVEIVPERSVGAA